MEITLVFSSGKRLRTTTEKLFKDRHLVNSIIRTGQKSKLIDAIEHSANNLLSWFIKTPNPFIDDSEAYHQYDDSTDLAFDDMDGEYNNILESDELYRYLTK